MAGLALREPSRKNWHIIDETVVHAVKGLGGLPGSPIGMSLAADSRNYHRIGERSGKPEAFGHIGKTNSSHDSRHTPGCEPGLAKAVGSRVEGVRQKNTSTESSQRPGRGKKFGPEKLSGTTTYIQQSHDGVSAAIPNDRPNGRPSCKVSYPVDRRHWQKRSHMALRETEHGYRPQRGNDSNSGGLRAKEMINKTTPSSSSTELVVSVASSLEEATGPPSAPRKGRDDGDVAGGFTRRGYRRKGDPTEASRSPGAAQDERLLSWVNSILSSPTSEAESSR